MEDLPPNTASSYSDPIYDRLEGANSWLGRNWLIVVAAAIAIIAGALYWRSASNHTPYADDARRLYVADRESLEQGATPLLAVMNDETIDATLRAEAGLRAAAILQDGNNRAEAKSALSTALGLAGTDQSLRLSIILSQAAVAEDEQQYDAAISSYREAQTLITTTPNTGGLDFLAGLGIARSLLAQDDPAKRDEAIAVLERLANNNEPGTDSFQRMVSLQLARLKHNVQPTVAEVEPAAAVIPEAPEATEATE